MGYTVNEMTKPQTDWLTHVADVKRVGYGEKAAFRTKLEGVTAFIQAKGATPARSKIAHKQVTLDTVAVSARPVINVYELRTGRVQMADLIRDASYEMHVKQIQYIQQVLNTAAASWESPFYGTGSGIVKTVLNPMIQHWMRTGAVTLLGDARHGRRPSFIAAARPEVAEPLLETMKAMLEEKGLHVETGRFRAHMDVELVNDGPVTILIDSRKVF